MRIPTSKQDKGFTLIELLVVVVIIGVLAAVAIPVFLNQRQKAVDSGIKSDLKNAATAVETWATKNPVTAVPDETVLGGAAGASGGPLEGFTASQGNTVKVSDIAGTVGAYMICAFNAGASASKTGAAGTAIYYDSTKGGLQPTALVAAC